MDILYIRIRELREKLGLTQDELAKKVGYTSRSTINKIELGKNDISQSKIAAFAKALNTTPAYLMGWEEKEPATDDDELFQKNVELFNSLSDEKQKQALDFLRFLKGE